MSTKISNPADVKAGDQVDYVEYNPMHSRTVQAEVVKATATGLTVRLRDGSELRRAYTAKVKTSGWGGGVSTHFHFRKLDAHDLWVRARPNVTVVVVEYRVGFTVAPAALRDKPDTVLAELRALADWLALEPAKETES